MKTQHLVMLRFYLLGVKMKEIKPKNNPSVLGKTFGKIHYRLISTVHESRASTIATIPVSKNS
jgi:hypothetical protein